MVASVLESRIVEVADTKERTKASGFIDRPRLAFNKRLEQIEEDMNEQLTVFDENLNMNLYTVVTPEENPNVAPGQIGIGTAKARLNGFDMTRYKTTDYPLMLDFFMSYGEDPDNLFEMLFHCASPAPFFLPNMMRTIAELRARGSRDSFTRSGSKARLPTLITILSKNTPCQRLPNALILVA